MHRARRRAFELSSLRITTHGTFTQANLALIAIGIPPILRTCVPMEVMREPMVSKP
jgi:hypothetical protein